MNQMKVVNEQTSWSAIYCWNAEISPGAVQEWRQAIYELANESRGGAKGPRGHGLSTLSQTPSSLR